MPQIINTNVSSLNAQRNLDRSQSSLSTSLQRLSSGLRINSAKDDAAGMAISSRMSAQISGLNQARRNANDGVSLSQTAESALSSIGDNLNRMRDLAVQAANATNSDADRAALNQEVMQLQAEIQRVGEQTDFNGRKLLDGSFTNQYFQIGANATQGVVVNLTDSRASAMGADYASQTLGVEIGKTGDMRFKINGIEIDVTIASETVKVAPDKTNWAT
jgi:flagellin